MKSVFSRNSSGCGRWTKTAHSFPIILFWSFFVSPVRLGPDVCFVLCWGSVTDVITRKPRVTSAFTKNIESRKIMSYLKPFLKLEASVSQIQNSLFIQFIILCYKSLFISDTHFFKDWKQTSTCLASQANDSFD